jgi:hypothetical protein
MIHVITFTPIVSQSRSNIIGAHDNERNSKSKNART